MRWRGGRGVLLWRCSVQHQTSPLRRVSSRPESYDRFFTSFPMPFEPVRAPVLTERATAARVVKKQSQVTSAVDEPENTEFPADLKAFLAAIGSDRRVVGSAAGALPTTDSEDDTDDMVDVPALPSTVAALQEDGEMTLADGTTTGRMHILATAALPSSRVHLNNFVDDDGSGSDPDVVFEDEISLPVSGGRAGVTLVDASVGVTSCPDAVDEVLPFDDGSESGNE